MKARAASKDQTFILVEDPVKCFCGINWEPSRKWGSSEINQCSFILLFGYNLSESEMVNIWKLGFDAIGITCCHCCMLYCLSLGIWWKTEKMGQKIQRGHVISHVMLMCISQNYLVYTVIDSTVLSPYI